MFCPKCGSENQSINSYCRNCGLYLLDFEQLSKKTTTPEEHLKINGVLTFMSGAVSLILAILLHIMFTGKESTSILIYIVIGFLTANFFWQAQTFWRTILLKKQISQNRNNSAISPNFPHKVEDKNSYSTDKLLTEPTFNDFVPTSVTENTTKHLQEIKQKSSQSKH